MARWSQSLPRLDPVRIGSRRSSWPRAPSEPVAAVRHPPAKHADGNRRQQRPKDGQGDIRDQSQHNEGSPEDLTLHSFILARAIAPRPPATAQISRRTHGGCPVAARAYGPADGAPDRDSLLTKANLWSKYAGNLAGCQTRV